MQYHIGCSGFYNKDWKEVFYPEGLPQSKWFEYYCSHFNTIELNTTFYRFPRIDFLQKWYDKSPEDFKFSVKAPRLITHYKRFNEAEGLLQDFYSTIQEGLKEKLGPVLFQLPSTIIYGETFLQSIIKNMDRHFNNVIEFRHESWWNNYVYDQLSQHKISFCGISHPILPDKMMVTSNLIYYRFHGIPKLYFSRYSLQTIKKFAEEVTEKAKNRVMYIYFNNTATLAAIKNAEELESFLLEKPAVIRL